MVKPSCTLPPMGMDPFQEALRTTLAPLATVRVPFQRLVMVEPRVNDSVQPLTAWVPLFWMMRSAV